MHRLQLPEGAGWTESDKTLPRSPSHTKRKRSGILPHYGKLKGSPRTGADPGAIALAFRSSITRSVHGAGRRDGRGGSEDPRCAGRGRDVSAGKPEAHVCVHKRGGEGGRGNGERLGRKLQSLSSLFSSVKQGP